MALATQIKLRYTGSTMILFLYGEDTFRLKQKIREMKQKYISASLGNTNLAILDGKTVTADEIIRQVLAYPFLAKSRLVMIENLLLEGKKPSKTEASSKNVGIQEKIGDFLPKVPETTVLVFVEAGVPDKRTSLFKKLNKLKMAQEFKPLSEAEVKTWTRQEVAKLQAEITPDAVEKLFLYVGTDLWQLSNEIAKLATYNKSITPETVELLVRAQTQSDIFTLIDALASQNKKKAFLELHRLTENGENELYILSMIVYQYRNMLVVRDFVERGVTSSYDLASRAKLHPFVAGKTLNLVRNYKLDELKDIYSLLLEQDIAIKTGKIQPGPALDLLVLNLVQA